MNPSIYLRRSILTAVATATLATTQAADVTFSSSATYTDTQTYDNGTITGYKNVVTLDTPAVYTFNDNLTLTPAWNRLTLNNGAALNVTGSVIADTSGISLNGGTLTTGGLQLMDMALWDGSYSDGKQIIENGDSIINGTTVVASQSNATFIQKTIAASYPADSANNLWLGNDGATIDSNGYDIGITMAMMNFSGQTGSLTKTGAGTLTLTAANNYTGATTVSGGTLNLPDGDWVTGGPFTAGGATGAITVGSGATLSTSNSVTRIQNGLTLNGGTVSSRGNAWGTGNNTWGNLLLSSDIAAGNSATSTISSEIRLDADRSMDVESSSTLNISGGIALCVNYTGEINVCGITKTGSGTLTLSGTNSYNGATTVSGGTLALQNTYGSSGFAISTGATLELNVASGLRDLAGTTFSGTGTLSKTGAGDAIWGAGVATFALGAGSWIDVQAGSIIGGSFGNENWTGNLSGLNVASGATFSGVEANVRIDALTGAGTISSGYVGAGYANFTFGVNNGSGTFSGSLTDGAAAGNFVKEGSGTQTLSGTNSYTGSTTVTGGTLKLGNGTANTSLANTSEVSVASGCTLTLDFSNANSDTIDKLWLGGVQQSPGVYGAGSYSGATITGSGTLTVLNGPPADPFANWMATNYPAIVSPNNQPGADPDNDGISNLMEYILQVGNPSVSTTGTLPTLNASGANFVFTYYRRAAATGTTQTFEYSTTLGAGSWTPVAIPGGSGVTVTDQGGGIEKVEITVAKGANTKLFGRLQVTKL